jgi:hypothetical protein
VHDRRLERGHSRSDERQTGREQQNRRCRRRSDSCDHVAGDLDRQLAWKSAIADEDADVVDA